MIILECVVQFYQAKIMKVKNVILCIKQKFKISVITENDYRFSRIIEK